MTDKPTEAGKGDQRGCPPGAGQVQPAHGGRIGNPPFVPTDEQRARVRTLAKIFPPHSQHHIAIQIKHPDGRPISEDTLSRHFRMDMAEGRAELLSTVGALLIKRAIEGPNADGVKGDPDIQKYIMRSLAGWGRVEVTGPNGGPIQTIDLSRLNAAQLQEYGRISAIAEGVDPDSILIEHIPDR